jgi:peptidoglycan hydrolase CwlO-like protein
MARSRKALIWSGLLLLLLAAAAPGVLPADDDIGRFVVRQAGDRTLLLDSVSGRTWRLEWRGDRAAWVPVAKIDHPEQVEEWRRDEPPGRPGPRFEGDRGPNDRERTRTGRDHVPHSIDQLREQIRDAERQQVALRERFGPEHPLVQQAQRHIEALLEHQNALARELEDGDRREADRRASDRRESNRRPGDDRNERLEPGPPDRRRAPDQPSDTDSLLERLHLLHQELGHLREELEVLRQQHGPEHPEAQRINAWMNNLREAIAETEHALDARREPPENDRTAPRSRDRRPERGPEDADRGEPENRRGPREATQENVQQLREQITKLTRQRGRMRNHLSEDHPEIREVSERIDDMIRELQEWEGEPRTGESSPPEDAAAERGANLEQPQPPDAAPDSKTVGADGGAALDSSGGSAN